MQTDRILLRRWTPQDAEALYRYASDPEIGPRAGWPVHRSVADSRAVIAQYFSNDCTWAIVCRATGEPIGCIGYYTQQTSNIHIAPNDCEVGYWVGRPFWNKGICTEALHLLLHPYPVRKDHCGIILIPADLVSCMQTNQVAPLGPPDYSKRNW